MAAGDPFTDAQRAELAAAVDLAEQQVGGLRIGVYVGDLPDGRDSARARLAAYGADADRTVLVALDPTARIVEIVTGSVARRRLDDRGAALAVLSMTSTLALGDVVAGIKAGLAAVGEHARPHV